MSFVDSEHLRSQQQSTPHHVQRSLTLQTAEALRVHAEGHPAALGASQCAATSTIQQSSHTAHTLQTPKTSLKVIAQSRLPSRLLRESSRFTRVKAADCLRINYRAMERPHIAVTGRELAKLSRDASEQFLFMEWCNGIGPETEVIPGAPLFVFLRRCIGRVDEEETFTASVEGFIHAVGDLSRGDLLPPDKLVLTIRTSSQSRSPFVSGTGPSSHDDCSTVSAAPGDVHVPTRAAAMPEYTSGEPTTPADRPVEVPAASHARRDPPERPSLPTGWVFHKRLTKRHYLVSDESHIERVLKYFDDEAEFQDEWNASEAIKIRCPEWHEFLVPLERHWFCKHDKVTYASLRFIRYPTLDTYRITSVNEVERITVALVDAVARLHQASFAHLDIKPSNVFVDVREHSQTVLLADFTLSTERKSHTAAFRLHGTFDYLPRSYRKGQRSAGAWVDCYSIGVTVQQMLDRLKHLGDTLEGEHWLNAFVDESRKETWGTSADQVRWIQQHRPQARPSPQAVPQPPRLRPEVKVRDVDAAELMKRASVEFHQGHLKEALNYWAQAADADSIEGVAEYLERAWRSDDDVARRLSAKVLEGGYRLDHGLHDGMNVMSKARFFASLNLGKTPTLSLGLSTQPEFKRLLQVYERLLGVCSIARFSPAETVHPAVKDLCSTLKLPAELLHQASGLVLRLMPRPTGGGGEADCVYYLSKAFVSQRQWQAIMGPLECQIQGAELAVHTVSFHECRRYVERVGLELPEWRLLKEVMDLAGPSRASNVAKEALAVDSNRLDRLGLIQFAGALSHWCKDEPDVDGRCTVFGLSHRDRDDADLVQTRLAASRAWIGLRPVLTIPLRG